MKDPTYVHLGSLKIHRAWIMLAACASLSIGYLALIFAANGNFYVAICDDLGIARSQISMWQQVHFLAAAVFMPVYGSLYEKFSLRILLSFAAASCIVGALLMSTYTEWWQWMISGFLYGSAGAGLMYLPSAVILGNWFHKRQGFALGIALAISSLAGALVSPLFAALIEALGWRMSYVIQGALIALFTLPFTLFVIVKDPRQIGAKPYGWDAKADEAKDSREAVEAHGGGVPFKKGLFSLAFVTLFIFAGISALIGSGFDAHMPGFAVSIGYSPMFGSLMVSALFAGSCFEKLFMGWLNDKIGVQNTVFLELLLVIVALLGLTLFRGEAVLLGLTFIFGVQDSFLSLSLPLLVRAFFGDLDFTRLYAWVSMGSGILGSFGSPLVGAAYDITGSYFPAFYIAAILCAFGGLCLVVGRRNAKRLAFVEPNRPLPPVDPFTGKE